MKFTYFNLFGRGEPIRMAMWKAGVEYEDVRFGLGSEEWNTLKASGELEFGQVPMLTLDDGTKLFQTTAIINYLGQTYNLVGEDPITNYRGEKAV